MHDKRIKFEAMFIVWKIHTHEDYIKYVNIGK